MADSTTLEQLLPVLSVVAAPAGGVIGVWFGQRTERRARQREWLREQRMASYSDLLSRLHMLWRCIEKYRRVPSDETRWALVNAGNDVDRAKDLVLLLGPNQVAGIAVAAHQYMKDLHEDVLDSSSVMVDVPLSSHPLAVFARGGIDNFVQAGKLVLPDE